MSTKAYIGSQTLFQMGDGLSPEGFVTIGEVVSGGPIAQKKDLIEVTNLISAAKEYTGGLTDGQPVSVVCNYIPDDPKQLALWTAAGTTSTAKNFKYVLPATASGGTKTYSFAALVLGASIDKTTPNTAQNITFDLKISGAITGPV
jgi:hypothetical protein